MACRYLGSTACWYGTGGALGVPLRGGCRVPGPEAQCCSARRPGFGAVVAGSPRPGGRKWEATYKPMGGLRMPLRHTPTRVLTPFLHTLDLALGTFATLRRRSYGIGSRRDVIY